jgi:hypothetical protein
MLCASLVAMVAAVVGLEPAAAQPVTTAGAKTKTPVLSAPNKVAKAPKKTVGRPLTFDHQPPMTVTGAPVVLPKAPEPAKQPAS